MEHSSCCENPTSKKQPGSSGKAFSSNGMTFRPLIGNEGAALARRKLRAGRGVACGLALHLGIQFSPDDDDDGGDPHPHHEANHGSERAIGGVVVSKILEVEREAPSDDEPANGCKYS